MDRCRQCNSTLAPKEQVCWACNSPVEDLNPKPTLASRFQSVLNVLFIVFAVLSVLALFLPAGYVPPFKHCVVGLLVIGLVRSSSVTMTEAKKH
jgi:hypothetical protein